MEFQVIEFGFWLYRFASEYSNLNLLLECEPALFCSLIVRSEYAFLGITSFKASDRKDFFNPVVAGFVRTRMYSRSWFRKKPDVVL